MRIKLTEQQVTGLVNNLVGDIDLEKQAPETVKLLKNLVAKPAEKAYGTAQAVGSWLKGKKEKTPEKTTTQPSTAQVSTAPPIDEMLHPLGHIGKITSYYGPRNSPIDPITGKRGSSNHKGVDLAAKSGSPVYSPLDGVVIVVRDTGDNPCGGLLQIDHGTLVTKFCHLRQFNTRVGKNVKKGQVVAYSGGGPKDPMRGTSTNEHLHYEILHKDGSPYDPIKDIDANLTA